MNKNEKFEYKNQNSLLSVLNHSKNSNDDDEL